jgi:hypothetical protein
MLGLFVLFGLCNFLAISRVVVVFVTIMTPYFSLLFLPSVTSTYTTGKEVLLSSATDGAGPFVWRILSRFSKQMKYEIADS